VVHERDLQARIPGGIRLGREMLIRPAWVNDITGYKQQHAQIMTSATATMHANIGSEPARGGYGPAISPPAPR
jgi:hypothetical protein